MTFTAAKSHVVQQAEAKICEWTLRIFGFPSKLTSKLPTGSILIRLGNRRTVDVYPSGKLVLAFKQGDIDYVQGFRFTDILALVKTLKSARV